MEPRIGIAKIAGTIVELELSPIDWKDVYSALETAASEAGPDLFGYSQKYKPALSAFLTQFPLRLSGAWGDYRLGGQFGARYALASYFGDLRRLPFGSGISVSLKSIAFYSEPIIWAGHDDLSIAVATSHAFWNALNHRPEFPPSYDDGQYVFRRRIEYGQVAFMALRDHLVETGQWEKAEWEK